MQDRDFFDLLYQQWSKTTGAENQFWASEENHNFPGEWVIWSVDQDDNRTQVAYNLREVDADFIAGLHGCFGDLVRRWHAALDSEEESEKRADEAVQDQFKLATELAELKVKYGERTEDYHGQAT